MRIFILNGPNLNFLGKREPAIYGSQTFEEYLSKLRVQFPAIDIAYAQSNYEGALVEHLQKEGFVAQGIILNAAAFTHTSVALRDTIALINAPVIEVHISNVYARENFRHHSFIAPVCAGSIVGLGLRGYELALHYFATQRHS